MEPKSRMTPNEAFNQPYNSYDTHQWLSSASEEELREFRKLPHMQTGHVWYETANAALMVQIADRASRPHWTMTPVFWVTVLGMIFAAIAAFPEIRSWFQDASSSGKDASSPPPQSNSVPAKIESQKISPTAPAETLNTNQAPSQIPPLKRN